MMELVDVELHEQSNQIRIVLYERKQHGCNKSHYTKNNWYPKLFNFVPLESDSPFKFGTLWFTTKRQWLKEFQSLLVQDFCLGQGINLVLHIVKKYLHKSRNPLSGQKYNGNRVREFYGENRPKMVYNDSEFVADRKIIELNQVENTEADVFYEGWLQDKRHKIKNEDLEINKG